MEIINICCISEDEDFGVLLQTLHGKSCSILFEKISALCKMFEFLFGMAIEYGAMSVTGC